MMEKGTRLCTTCKQEVAISLFGKLSRSKDGLSNKCKVCRSITNKKCYYKNHDETKQKRNNKARARYNINPEKYAKCARDNRRRLRLETLEIYGNRCNCCGEQEETFLTIDHIYGDGNIHRREVGNNSISVLQAIRREGYPKDKYQILCFNCNRSKYVLGTCAHKYEERV